MKIETQIQEDHQAKLIVEVEAEMLEGAKRKAARKLANRIKIPGFRPGKAPYPVILKQVGEDEQQTAHPPHVLGYEKHQYGGKRTTGGKDLHHLFAAMGIVGDCA